MLMDILVVDAHKRHSSREEFLHSTLGATDNIVVPQYKHILANESGAISIRT
jgi:hypothetical protein